MKLKNWRLTLLSLVILLIGSVDVVAQKIVGYIPQYRSTTLMDDQVEWGSMTEAYYFGSVPTTGGGITIEAPSNFEHVKLRASENGLNTWLSIGGWGKSGNFIGIANNPTYRQNFANEALLLCQTHGLTGIDIDWEFPSYGQEAAFRDFFKTLHETLNPAGYLVSAAAGGESTHADKWLAETFTYIDDLNIMSYDAPTATYGNHASLQFMIDAMELYKAQGCPYEKMLGGVAFYSRCASESRYMDILSASSDKQATFENDLTSGKCYNGKNTIEAKIDHVMGKGGLGILIWEVTQDVKGQYSLLNACDLKMEDYRCPVTQPDLGDDVSICGTSSVTLNSNVSGSYTYSWKKNTAVIPGSASTLIATSAGIYEVTVSDGLCSRKDEIEVLGVLPTIDLGSGLDLCDPSVATLDAGVSGSGLNYSWAKNSTTISGATNQTLEVTKAGTYQVTVSASGCSSVNDQVIITSSLVDVDDETVCNGQTGTFTVNNPGSFNYKWYTSLSGPSEITTANSYTTPNLSSTTNYYVEKDDPTGGVCNGKGTWSASTTFNSDPATSDPLIYEGKLYQRIQWWTQGDQPDISPSVWTEIGACGSACLRTKVTAIIDNGCSSNPAISVVANMNNVCETTNITFTATATDAGVSPIFVWTVNGVQKQSSTSTTYSSTTLKNSDVVQVSLASDGSVKDQVTMTLSTPLSPSVSISEGANNICLGTGVTFTASPTNGGTPTYKWFVGTTQQSETSSSFTYVPTNGDAVKVEMTTSLTCVTGVMATSNVVNMIVNPSTTPSVVISESTNNVCSGTNVTFSATPSNAGSTPTYDWMLNSSSTGVTTPTYSSTSLVNGDKVKLLLTSSDACPSGAATSNEVTMIINPTITPSASVVADKNPICPGENVTFSAILTNEGGAPTYDWMLNNSSTGISTPTYSSTGFVDSDKIKLIITSSASCTSSSTATSNEVTMSVGAAVTPSVSISEDANNVCSGTSVTFTASPTNGGTPTYKWFVGTTQQSETSSSFTYVPTNNDAVKVEMTTSLTCVAGTMATSNVVNMIVNPSTTPSVVISESTNNVCSGTNVTFSATPSNAGSTPTYDWMLNSSSTGVTTPTYSSTSLVNGDKVKLLLTSSDACPSGAATSNEVTMVINPTVTPTAVIVSDINPICPGENVTFSATLSNEGTIPTYDWVLNSSSTGITTPTYSSTSLVNGDKVKLIITSSALCATSSTAASNEITMNVGAAVTPVVSISEGANNVCSGTSVTFTASPTNGGTPTYKWFVGTTQQAETSSSFTYVPTNGDAVKVEMTTSLTCVTGAMATSNVVNMIVNPSTIPSVVISESVNNVCSGTNVTFSAIPSNAGSTPTYDWMLNSSSTGVTTPTYSSTSLINGDKVKLLLTSSDACPSGAATSNEVTMLVKSPVSTSSGIANQNLNEGFSTYQIDLSTAFTGNNLSYSASPATVVGISISGSMATISDVTTGSESITVTAQDACGMTAQTQIQFTVTALGVINPTLTVSQPSGTSITLTEGGLLNVNFNAIALQGSLTTISAEVKDAGTGSLVNTINLNNSGDTYSGSWVSTPGTYNLLITVADDQGGLSNKTILVTVSAIVSNQVPTVILSVNPSLGITEGDLVSVSWVANDVDGTVDVEVIKLDNAVQSWTSGSVWTATSGSHTISVTVTDNDGATATDQITFSVASVSVGDNEAVITFISPLAGERLGDDTYLVQVTATDADGLSNVQLKVVNTSASFPFNQATLVDLTNSGNGSYSGDWSPAINGTYDLTIITTDNNGETTTSSTISVTVDDQFGVGLGDDLDPSRLSMVVYPNPTLGDVTVDYNIDVAGEGTLTLLDMNGSLLDVVSEGGFNVGIQSISLSTNDLPVGIYILKLSLNGEVIIKKLVKE